VGTGTEGKFTSAKGGIKEHEEKQRRLARRKKEVR